MNPATVQRRVLAVLLSTVLLTTALPRLQGVGGVGGGSQSLTHYDEGVYVLNGYLAAFGQPLNFNFEQPLHSPPLYPWMVGAVCGLLGAVWPGAGQLVGGLAGIATVFLVFAVGRRVANVQVGIVAASLLALSDLHIAYSRMALTDVPLGLTMLIAIYFAIRLLEVWELPEGSRAMVWVWSICLGAATGLAWNTKYNGWMPVAITWAAAVILVVRARLQTGSRRIPSAVTLWGSLAVATLIAVLCFVPWYRFVETNFQGGYAAVTAHHRTYVHGLIAWPSSAWRLAQSLAGYRHHGWWIGTPAGGIAALLILRLRWRAMGSHARGALGLLAAAVLMAATFFWGLDVTLIIVAVMTAGPLVIWGRSSHVLVGVWVLAFAVLVPCYQPFVRLLIPLAIASSLATAMVLVSAANLFRGKATLPAGSVLAISAVISSALLIAGHPFGVVPTEELWNRWSSEHSYQAFGALVSESTEPEAFIVCQGQPPLSLYVQRERLPIGNTAFADAVRAVPLSRPCYLAVDFFWLHSQPGKDALRSVERNRARLRLVGQVENDLTFATLADFLTPAQIANKLAVKPEEDRRVIPPPLEANRRDVITLFRVERP